MRRWLPALLGAVLLAGAPQQRPVLPQGAGPQRLDLDLALLAQASRDLHDLRLLDREGRELPFVRVPPAAAAPDWHGGRLLPLPAGKESSGFELDLGRASEVERLRVEGLPRPLLKRFRLEGSGDRARWTVLVAEGTLFDLPEEALQLLTADFPRGSYRYLRLTWDDRSSARLPLPRTAAALGSARGSAVPLLEPVPFEARAAEPGMSRYHLRLPGRGLPLVALRLGIGGGGPLLRQASVQEPRLQGGRLLPRSLGRAELRRAERGGASAGAFRIPIAPPEGAELELCLENGANPPLQLLSVVAEAGPQPWIYFESPEGAAVQARFGDASLAAPRYDLEALRDRLSSAATGTARWGPAAQAAADVDRSLDPGPAAGLSPKEFRNLRPLPPSGPGLAALLLDPHVLAQSTGLADLRLLDAQDRQVPYLLERRDAPLELRLALPAAVRDGRESHYLLPLPQRRLGDATLVLETAARTFRRDLRVELQQGGGPRLLWQGAWVRAEGGGEAILAVPLAGSGEGDLRLGVDEGDNQPLPLSGARLLLPAWRLRFFHPGTPLRLAYGAELGAPQYDLALLADRLRAVPARELVLADAPAPGSGSRQTLLFWGALAGATLALLILLGRLLKRPDAPA